MDTQGPSDGLQAASWQLVVMCHTLNVYLKSVTLLLQGTLKVIEEVDKGVLLHSWLTSACRLLVVGVDAMA
jgi:hypothetical protein